MTDSSELRRRSSDLERSWKLDRSVNVGDLLVFISLLAAGVGYVLHQDQRSTRTEDAILSIQATTTRHDSELKEMRQTTDQKLDRLEDKVDRVLGIVVRRGK